MVAPAGIRGVINERHHQRCGLMCHIGVCSGVPSAALGSGAGKGNRQPSHLDEDSTTLAVEASRLVVRDWPPMAPDALWFATTSPTYMEKTSATILHAALRLGGDVIAADVGIVAAWHLWRSSAARSTESSVLVASGDIRMGMAGSPDEKDGGDAGSAILVGESTDRWRVISRGDRCRIGDPEFLDRWRAPGDLRTHSWEDRFGEQRYAALATTAFDAALKDAGVDADQLATVAISTPRPRAAAALSKNSGPLV